MARPSRDPAKGKDPMLADYVRDLFGERETELFTFDPASESVDSPFHATAMRWHNKRSGCADTSPRRWYTTSQIMVRSGGDQCLVVSVSRLPTTRGAYASAKAVKRAICYRTSRSFEKALKATKPNLMPRLYP